MTGLNVESDPLAKLVIRAGDGAIIVVNFVRLQPGKEAAHQRYLDAVGPILARYGGLPSYAGESLGTLIGEEHWDRVAITHYPSTQALHNFVTDPDFVALAPLRHDALEAGVVHVFRAP